MFACVCILAFIWTFYFFLLSKLSTVLPNLFDQIAKETKETCKERGIPYLDEEKESNLKKQIENLFKGENNVYSLISKYKSHCVFSSYMICHAFFLWYS